MKLSIRRVFLFIYFLYIYTFKLTIMKGKLLVASPSILKDYVFNRSVIYLTEHNRSEGSVGFILNKPTNFKVQDFVADLHCNFKVYRGGPVHQDNLYFIHNVPQIIPNSIHIDENIYWGGDFEELSHLLNTRAISEKNIRFFLGYSGWDTNQLYQELEDDAWITFENNYENLLSIESNSFWRKSILKLDDKHKIWANSPKNPILN